MPENEISNTQNTQNKKGLRVFFVIEKNGEFFKGYDLFTGKVEFTKDIMESRWFTHTRAAKPRAGERIIQLYLDIGQNSISLQL